MDKYDVDIYIAGHVHSYSVTWPLTNGKVTQTNLRNPTGVVHVLEGTTTTSSCSSSCCCCSSSSFPTNKSRIYTLIVE